METYDVKKNRYENPEKQEETKSVTLSYTRVFIYLAIALAITFGVSYGWPYLAIAVSGGNYEVASVVNIVGIVVSAIYMLVGGLLMSIKAFSKKTKAMAVMYYIHSFAMGILCSSIFYVATYETLGDTNVPIIALAFGISAGLMLMAAGLSYVLRKSMHKIIPFISILAVGILILTIINLFVWPFNGAAANVIYWIIDYSIFALIFLSICIDMFRINAMAKLGWIGNETNLAYYAAYTIYIDFIYLIIKVIYFLSLSNSKRR